MGKRNMDISLKSICGFVNILVFDRSTNKLLESITFQNTRTRVPIFYPHFIGFLSFDTQNRVVIVRGKFGISSSFVPESYKHSYEFDGPWDLFEEYYQTEELTIAGIDDMLLFYTAGISEYENYGVLGTQQGKWFWLQQDADNPIIGPKTIASIGYFAPLEGYIHWGYKLKYAFISFVNLPKAYELSENRIALIKYSWFVPWNEEVN